MTTTVLVSNTISTTGAGFTLAANGDQVVVAPNVFVGSDVSDGIYSTGGGNVIVNGVVYGVLNGILLNYGGAATNVSNVEIVAGSKVEESGGTSAIYIGAGSFSIQNYGLVSSLNIASGIGVDTSGPGTLLNYGTISGGDFAVYNADSVFSDRYTLYNYGSLIASYSFYSPGVDVDTVYNAGTMLGDVILSSGGGDLFNSTLGEVQGRIYCGSGGDSVIAGDTGGAVIGGAGADLLYANPTATAVANAAQTTLDGAGGANALYGDGAYVTFDAGDANGGTNQIWGEASQMAGVAGYTNNTVSFSAAQHGVFVDLLNGHNAYVSSSTNWTGTGTFEDSIAAAGTGLSSVPNVIGSNQNDVVVCDNGVDHVTGGGGADSLYAGTGASSQDTFVYNAYADSNVVNGYDTIVGFKIGTDKIDVSSFMEKLGLSPASLLIFTSGTSNTVYIEKTPGTFNSATDLALVVSTSTTGGLHASDFVL